MHPQTHEDLTEAQQKTLEAVKQYNIDHGWPPTRKELAEKLGVNCNAVDGSLRILKRKGFIHLEPGTARGVRLL